MVIATNHSGYGEWNFGSGILTVGKALSPINVAYSNQLVAGEEEDLGLGGFGDFDQSEITQVKLTFGVFSIAVIDPEKNAWVSPAFLTNDDIALYDTQAVIPMIALCYKANFNMGEFQISGGYNTFEIDDNAWTGSESNIAQSYYLQTPITLAPGVTVTPEVGMIDERETGEDETFYFGAAWAIAF